jgi:hypothetical protein
MYDLGSNLSRSHSPREMPDLSISTSQKITPPREKALLAAFIASFPASISEAREKSAPA